MWIKIAIFALTLALGSGQSSDELPSVNITQGTVVGSVAVDGEYFEFYGIPYADSTSGIHRFKAPSPPSTFQETFLANRRGIKCVRALGVGYEGTEDCLVANVFTPSLNNTRQLPVMVWVKGKEFDKVYENELSFKNFVEKDVVVVSLNFRESILGFLCLGTEIAPGNAGLKDIIAGLRWVKENIEQFGGNPDDITLFGHGSGAAAVDLVTLSPLANGLVQKAISQSGNAYAPWAVSRDNLNYAVQVAEALGHVVTNIQELSEVFTRTSVSALMAIINELELTDNSLAFSPCLERENLEGVEPFLLKSPYETVNDGEFLQIPFIVGYVDNEGTIRAEEALENDWLERMENSFSEFLQPDLQFATEEQELQIADDIKAYYFRNGPITMDDVGDYITYHGDTMMLVSTIREAQMRARVSTAPIYVYQFSYKGALGEPFVGPLEVESAAHSEELAYLFYDTPEDGVPLMDLTVGDILVERWTNFAKTGIPMSDTSQVPWRPFTSENRFYLRFLDDGELNDEQEGTLELELEDPHPETMAFWDFIYNDHFLDAVGRWELTERNEDEDEPIVDGEEDEIPEEDGIPDEDGIPEEDGVPDEDGIPEEDGNPDEDGLPDEDGVPDENGTTDDNQTDSASTTVGYTFSIVTLFTILNKFHLSQILS